MLFFQTKELNDKKKECFIDNKTGLNNTVGMLYLLENLHHQFERYEENWSFMIFLADINENVSSGCSDITQKDINLAISQLLKDICRTSDIIAFCEDNKFCILTRVFEGDDTVEFANKILKNLKSVNFNNCTLDINAKFGITFSKHGDDIESFVSRAEDALKKAIEADENIVLGV